MNTYIIISIIAIICIICSILFSSYFYFMYKNLRKNFKLYMKFVENKYIEKDNVILHNAIIDALCNAINNNYVFEEKAYKELLERIKRQEGD